MKIKFCGGVGRVTGSNHYLEAAGKKILIDCGLYQGSAENRGKNTTPFSYNPKEIDFVIATHSHIDHIGRIPKLVQGGFRGRIISTKPIKDLSAIFLEDELKIMTSEERRYHDNKMFWDRIDLSNTLKLWEGHDYHQRIDLGGVVIEFLDAGHILGSSIVKIEAEGKRIFFSGDLGNPPVPILARTEDVDGADYAVIESTYGDRLHEKGEEKQKKLEEVIEEIQRRKGVLLIPAFALEKTQELLYALNSLVENHLIERIPVFIDSPLAIKATEVYDKYNRYLSQEAQALSKTDQDIFGFPGLTICRTMDQSRAIKNVQNPKIIMAGSGMSTGGRILFHEQLYLPDPNNIILFVGYQVRGTLGRRIKEGEKIVKIMGKEVEVNAEIREISAFSSHADQKRLMDWVAHMLKNGVKPKNIFVVHGEPEASLTLAKKIHDELGINAVVPQEDNEFIL